MIKIFTREHCAYCPQVKRYYDTKGVKYEVFDAEGDDYAELSSRFGFTVPLVYNPENNLGMVGFNILKLKEIAEIA